MKPQEFGRLTPGELYDMLEGHRWRMEQAARDRVSLAWYTAMFSRQKTLKPLESYLKADGKVTVKSIDERRQDVEELKRELGDTA